MHLPKEAELLRIFIGESDKWQGKPLYEAIVHLARERGLREQLLLVVGGTQVTDDLAREAGMDAGFGRGTTGQDVASFLVKRLRSAENGAS